MNKKIATLFICSFIALLVNSTPIDSADNANLSTGIGDGHYEVTPMPAGAYLIRTLPPALASRQVGETSSNGKNQGLPSVTSSTNAPQAVSFVSPPVTAPTLVAQNTTNGTVTPPPLPITNGSTTEIPIPTVPTESNTTNTTETPTTTTSATTTTTVVTTTTTTGTTTSTTNSTTPPTPVTTSATTTTAVTTTPAPTPTAAPSKDRRFDGPSFIGGIVLSLGIMAIGFVAWKFYKARTERNYHTL